MKKFVIFALAVLVAFAMCSCQPTTENLDGDVEFKIYTNAQASKALSIVQDLGADEVDKIQLAFIPAEQVTDHINCQYKIGTEATVNSAQSTSASSLTWHDNLITWDTTDNTATWNTDAKLYLSQGKWTIYARAVDEDTNPLYEGNETVFVNKKNASTTITLIPVASDATGTLVIEALKASKVFDDPTKEQLVYSIEGITGSSSVDDTVIKALTTQTDGATQYVFEDATETLAQGSYILSVRLQQDVASDTATSADWEDYTGGSIIDFGIYKNKTTKISGDVEASDYLKTTADIEIKDAVFGLTITNTNDDNDKVDSNGKIKLKYTAEVTVEGENAEALQIQWYVGGTKVRTQQLTASATGEITDDIELEVDHGSRYVQAIVVGYVDKTDKSKITAKSEIASDLFDSRDRL